MRLSGRSRHRVGLVAVLALLLAACGGGGGSLGGGESDGAADDDRTDGEAQDQQDQEEDEEERGTLPYDETIEVFVADLQVYWAELMPEVYGEQYEPIPEENLIAFERGDPDVECGGVEISYDELEGNAFYCDTDDLIVWDNDQLFPELYDRYGGFVIGLTLAHEWGHAIQARVGVLEEDIVVEQMADCSAGAWVQHVEAGESDEFDLDQLGTLDAALSGFLQYRDPPGYQPDQPGAHGSAFDRVNAFQEGFEQEEERCAEYPDDPPAVVALGFGSQDDFESGGNLAYEEIFDLLITDLDAYWSDEIDDYDSIDDLEPYDVDDGDELPQCGDEDVDPDQYEETAFYCAEDHFIAWDDEYLEDLYDATGDLGPAVLLANAYSSAVQAALEVEGERREIGLQADCLSGSWVGSVPPIGTRDEAEIFLSPGDLDEVVQALLLEGGAALDDIEPGNEDVIAGVSRGTDEGTDGGGDEGDETDDGDEGDEGNEQREDAASAFERVQTFRTGFFDGVDSCLDLVE